MQNTSTAGSQLHKNGKLSNGVKILRSVKEPYKLELFWPNIIAFTILHILSVYGAYLLFTSAKILTALFAVLLYYFSGLGIAAGAHRLWAHRSYKANFPLRLLIAFMNTMAFQYSIIDWVRDHRMHHKYSDTNADPHNATRGFFFSHIGWLLCRKHPDLKENGKNIDLSDLYADPILRYQKRFYVPLVLLCCFYIPSAIPVYLWNESWKNAFFVCAMLRFILLLNATFTVNSLAHFFGNQPYDKNIFPRQNAFVSFVTSGEGWHNYHHTFPWDYKAAEFGSGWSITNTFIECCASKGWAYDLKSVSLEEVEKRVRRTGDGTHNQEDDEEKIIKAP